MRLASPVTSHAHRQRAAPRDPRTIDPLVARLTSVDRLPRQRQEAVLLVLAKAADLKQLFGHLGRPEHLVEFPINYKSGVSRDTTIQELQLQASVETDQKNAHFCRSRIAFRSQHGMEGVKTAAVQACIAKRIPYERGSSGNCRLTLAATNGAMATVYWPLAAGSASFAPFFIE
jgi:hypothetical protein